MIEVTRLNGSTLLINTDQILWVESRPDTVITLGSGEKVIVRERPAEVAERVRAFKHALAAGPSVVGGRQESDCDGDRG